MKKIIFLFLGGILLLSCNGHKTARKGFPVSSEITSGNETVDGLKTDSLNFETRPTGVLLTGSPSHRLTTIYKVNKDKRGNYFTGENHTYYSYNYLADAKADNWNNNLMPGLSIVYGYNMVNISHFNTETKQENEFFPKPVLIKNLYYPSYSRDTLNNMAVERNYILVSVYSNDSNKDGFINTDDLRRLYYFTIEGTEKTSLLPENYSAIKSEYDPANDYMYVFAKEDTNDDGVATDLEPIKVFWVDLKDPLHNGMVY